MKNAVFILLILFFSLTIKSFGDTNQLEIKEGNDYRIRNNEVNTLTNFQEFYFGSKSIGLLKNLFFLLSDNKKIISMNLNYNSRKIFVPKSSYRVAFFSFDELCSSNY